MKYFLLILLMFAPMAWAQIETEKTVTEMLAVKKADEAKPYLLHIAVLETITQYSTELGIDPVLFKKKLDEKYEAYFGKYKERMLRDKFGKNYQAELTEDQKKTFQDGLEAKKGELKIAYAKLDQLLESYTFKSIENDPSRPDTWKAVIALNLNRSKLENYNSRLLSDESKVYSKIFLMTDIDLIGLSWPELGLQEGSSFNNVLMTSWVKWLVANQPKNVEEIYQCSGRCSQEFISWQELPQEEGMQVSSDVANALWMKIAFKLRKMSFIAGINEWTFEWEGSLVLLDANTKMVMASYNLFPEKRTWRGLDQKALNSALASALYRSPMDALTKSTRKIQDFTRFNRPGKLVILGNRHLGDVLSLMDLLRNEGKDIHLQLQLDTISQNEVHLLYFYQGEEKSFIDLLSRLKELKSSHSYRIVNEFSGVHHVLKLLAE